MKEKEISVFVDESGCFNSDSVSSRYYLLCLVFHDQSVDVSNAIDILESSLESLGLDRMHCIHAGPLVRREQQYANMLREERRRILGRMMSFVRNVEFMYKCFSLDKKFLSGNTALHDILLQKLVAFLVTHTETLNGYSRLKIYYDDGQAQVKELLKEAFAIYASRTTFVEHVKPNSYRMFQVADVLCTLELLKLKLVNGERLSKSEFEFFNGLQNLRRNFLKPISSKEWR